MTEWWIWCGLCCFLGANFGTAIDHPVGWIFGLLVGFVVGTLPPLGPSLSFDPNDL